MFIVTPIRPVHSYMSVRLLLVVTYGLNEGMLPFADYNYSAAYDCDSVPRQPLERTCVSHVTRVGLCCTVTHCIGCDNMSPWILTATVCDTLRRLLLYVMMYFCSDYVVLYVGLILSSRLTLPVCPTH